MHKKQYKSHTPAFPTMRNATAFPRSAAFQKKVERETVKKNNRFFAFLDAPRSTLPERQKSLILLRRFAFQNFPLTGMLAHLRRYAAAVQHPEPWGRMGVSVAP